jgi:hypothetical protein
VANLVSASIIQQFLFCGEPILNIMAMLGAALQIEFISTRLNLFFHRECDLGPYSIRGTPIDSTVC